MPVSTYVRCAALQASAVAVGRAAVVSRREPTRLRFASSTTPPSRGSTTSTASCFAARRPAATPGATRRLVIFSACPCRLARLVDGSGMARDGRMVATEHASASLMDGWAPKPASVGAQPLHASGYGSAKKPWFPLQAKPGWSVNTPRPTLPGFSSLGSRRLRRGETSCP
jgi:hypothetical protein